MAIALYSKGTTHEVNGIKCTIRLVEPDMFYNEPLPGWHFKPEDIDNELQREEKKEADEEGPEIEDTQGQLKMLEFVTGVEKAKAGWWDVTFSDLDKPIKVRKVTDEESAMKAAIKKRMAE